MKGILITKDDNGQQVALQDIDESMLPEGDVTVRVACSSINYKDGLAITGASPVVRSFPMVPGIDFAGTVEASDNPEFKVGDKVVLNGWGVGEKHWGGLAELARVPAQYLIPLQSPFSEKQAMGIGTAGYTAMLCVLAIEKHGVKPEDGPVLVTGAAGGVGTVAVAVLAKLGYQVTAMTGRAEEADFLRSLGASDVIERGAYGEKGRPLGKELWAAAVDVAGGQVLANVCSEIKYGGIVAACGLAAGMGLPATVAPFILRGVTLAGIDSVMAPKEKRLEAWARLAQDLDIARLDSLMHEIPLDQVVTEAPKILEGKVRGRIVVPVG